MAKKTVSAESEQRAIRSITDGADETRNVLLSLMSEQHFAFPATNQIFSRINSLLKQGKPVPSSDILRADPALTDDAQALLDGQFDIVKSVDDARNLAYVLEKYRKRRLLFSSAKEIVEKLKTGGDEDDDKELEIQLLDQLETTLLSARSDFQESKIWHAGQSSNAQPIVERVVSPDKPNKILTGIDQFDKKTGGFSKGQLVTIAANTGGGKTVMAMQLCRNMYRKANQKTCLVSFEMDEEECYERILSGESKIPYDKINLHDISPTQKGKIYDAWKKFNQHGEDNNCKFSIWCPTGEFTLGQTFTYLKPYQYDVIVIDYISLLAQENAKEEMWSALGRMARIGKLMAKSLNCVVILLAQLAEDSNKIRYARAIKEHSNFLWTWNYDEKSQETGHVTMEQQKARNARQFPIHLQADFDVMSFQDWQGEIPSASEGKKSDDGEKAGSVKPTMDELADDANDL